MKVSLIRTGGFIPMIKKATEDVEWNDEEMKELISSTKANEEAGKMRDSHQYQLNYNEQTVLVDLEKVPLKYKEVIDKLKDNLQIVKPG